MGHEGKQREPSFPQVLLGTKLGVGTCLWSDVSFYPHARVNAHSTDDSIESKKLKIHRNV